MLSKGTKSLLSRTGISYTLAGALVFFILGIVFWGGLHTVLEATNSLDFCISCHEMESTVYPEYRQSVHYSNATGVRATCPDCHVPDEWLPMIKRKIMASRELYYWATGSIDTREKFEARRAHLAQRVWQGMQATDSRECRNCHLLASMSPDLQGRFASRIHQDAIDEGQTCIDCHKGIAHHLPTDEAALQATAPAADLDYGEEINETCAGCHGEYGQGTIDGEYPRLAGLDPAYIARQLRHFKDRSRVNIPMTPYATDRELPEDDVLAISAYLASIDLPSKLPPLDEESFDAFERLQAGKRVVNIARYPGDPQRGQAIYGRECATCHGIDGQGDRQRDIPQLAGQYSVYLLRQVENFREGERLHDDPRDAGIFRRFSDDEIDDVLAWLSVVDDR